VTVISGSRKDHSVPSGLAGLNCPWKKGALDDVPRRGRRVATGLTRKNIRAETEICVLCVEI
jgi:hypothetical protein